MARILVVDDDVLVRNSFSRLFETMGHDVLLAGNIAAAETEAKKGVDVIYLDLDLPDGNGIKAIDSLGSLKGHPEIVVVTGMGSLYGAQQTLQSNIWDYITKPASPRIIKETLHGALQYRKESRAKPVFKNAFDRCGIVGEDATMLRMLGGIEKAADSEASVLICGETGVGKELTARAIHTNSRRKAAPFVVVDCSNMTDTLVESLLYGHVKGAFTGAHTDRSGLMAEADGGTLFLDEVGELPPTLQKSFLRVLQERRYRPVGSARERGSDFRLVAATNRNLAEMVGDGTFRNDLLFRIRTVEIDLPPLRERNADKRRLAEHFIHRFCFRYGLETKQPSAELLTVVDGYRWPGNVRELASAMEAAVVHAGKDPAVYPKHLPASVRLSYLHEREEQFQETSVAIPAPDRSRSEPFISYRKHKQRQDREYFTHLLEVAGGDITTASQISGLSVPSVYRHLARAGIPTRNKGDMKKMA
jgi:two-component system NtrC family response regulator